VVRGHGASGFGDNVRVRQLAVVDVHLAELGAAQVRNFKRWPILGRRVWPNTFVGDSYEEEIAFRPDFDIGLRACHHLDASDEFFVFDGRRDWPQTERFRAVRTNYRY
jgi:hypothetical protein